MAEHPRHEQIVSTIASWYAGGDLVPFPFGEGRVSEDAAIVFVADPDANAGEVAAAVRRLSSDGPAAVWINDPGVDAALSADLVATGLVAGDADVYLAHVGSVPDVPVPRGLRLEPVAAGSLRQFAVTMWKGFNDTEDEPAEADVRREIELHGRQAEDFARPAIVRLGRVAVGGASWYAGPDGVQVTHLATRVPFRRQGVASAVLRHLLERYLAERWVVISCDPDGRPAQLYKRLGFTDPVYWRRTYTLVDPSR